MKSMFKKTMLAASCVAALGGISMTADAANWLMLQGTEKDGQAPRARVWGFVQAEYQYMKDTRVPAGAFAGNLMQPNLLGPERRSNEGSSIRRARIGVRGTGFPLDKNVNYFFLAEFGHNGITQLANGNGAARLSDASITLNHIKGARVRLGLFKTPGSEEGLAAIHIFDYTNFTNMADNLLLERFVSGNGSGTAGNGSTSSGVTNTPRSPIGAFRDVGVQVFDTFKGTNGWEHSYAVMIGNGNGINRTDAGSNGSKDKYLYWASEKVYGGKGGRRQGLKLFAWTQRGTRVLTTEGAGEYDRKRSGVGATFRKGKYRAAFEYVKADGMIINGTDGGARPGSVATAGPGAGTAVASLNVNVNGEANGWYVHGGYLIAPKWELDIRYDVLNRSTETTTGERKFDTLTLGAQYFLNKKSRITFNYEIRNLEAPGLASTHPANIIGDALENRVSLSALVIF